MLPLKIVGLGLYLPKQKENKDDFLKKGLSSRDINGVGVFGRRLMSETESIADMEERAASRALKDSGLKASEIDLIISAPSLPETVGVPNSNLLQHRLGAKNAAAFDIVQSCASVIPALVIAANFISDRQYNRILLTLSNNLSIIEDPLHPRVNYVLSDGAAAVVLTRSKPNVGILSYDIRTDGRFYYSAGSRIGKDHKIKYYDRHNDKLFFFIDPDVIANAKSSFGRYVLTCGPSTFHTALKKAKLSPQDIDCAIIYGVVKPIAEGWIKLMKVPRERCSLTYKHYGNLGLVTLFANLKKGLDKGMIKKGDTVAFVSMGAGFSAGCIIMRWS